MIFWIFVLLFVVSIVALVATEKICDKYEKGKSKFDDFVYWYDEPINYTFGAVERLRIIRNYFFR